MECTPQGRAQSQVDSALEIALQRQAPAKSSLHKSDEPRQGLGNDPSRITRVSASAPRSTADNATLRSTFSMDHEAQRTQEVTKKYSGKWLVGISAAGVLVSGLVLVIVLFPLLYSKSSSSHSLTDHYDQHVSQHSSSRVHDGSVKSETISNSKWPATHRDNSENPHNDTDKSSSFEFYAFYSHIMETIEKAMNTSVDPCHDFYQYACGSWWIHNPPPDGVSSWSNFEDMTIKIWSKMEKELEELLNSTVHFQHHRESCLPSSRSLKCNILPSIRDLVVNYYESCQNETILSMTGAFPLKDVLSRMDQQYLALSQQLQPLQVFQRLLEHVHHDLAVQAFFSWKVEPDNVIPNAMAIELKVPTIDLLQQGTDVEGDEKLITAYKQYASQILEMVGAFHKNNLDKEVNAILELLIIYQPLNGSPLVNKTTIESLNKIAPFLDWKYYFNKVFNRVGTYITGEEHILSQVQNYLAAISKRILSEISSKGLERLYIYLRWQVVQYYSQFLHEPARNTLFPLLNEITGVNATTISHFRFRPCIKEMEEQLPLAVVHLLQEAIMEELPQGTTISSTISEVEQMAQIIKMQYIHYIDSFAWLKQAAKHQLLEKLINIDIKVGYPSILDNHLDLQARFKNLKLNRTNLFHNQLDLLKFNQNSNMRFLRQPGLYSDWEALSPMSVTSFYIYRRNTLLIPLGGFMYPLYTAELPTSLVYATMGTFISHELGHSIDFVGRTRDKHGKANATLWDEATLKTFVEKVECRVQQYSEAYYPIKDLLTVAEVMADDGSVGTAYKAAYHQLQHTTFPAQISNLMSKLNLSKQQFFFLYYAQLFCSASSSGNTAQGLAHYPPHHIRVTATLANTPQFHTVFECHKGTKMNPVTQDCDIW